MANDSASTQKSAGVNHKMATPLFDGDMSKAAIVPFLTFHILIAVSNIVSNSLLLAALNKLKRCGTISFMFIKVLCTSDIIVGIFQFVYIFLRSTLSQYDSGTIFTLQLVVQTMFYLGSPFSGGMILIIAADRYVHMKYLTRYSQIMTHTRAWALIIANLVLQVTNSIGLMVASMRGYFGILQPIIVGAYIVMISVAITLYYGAYRSIKTRTRNSSVGIDAIPGSPAVERRSVSFEFSKAMLYILVSLAICYMPFLGLTTVRSLLLWSGATVPHEMMYALLWTYNINFSLSTVNVIIFINLNKDLKVHAKSVLGIRLGRKRSSRWTEVKEFSDPRLPRRTSNRLSVVASSW